MKIRLHIPSPLHGVGLVSFFTNPLEGMLFHDIGRAVFFERDVERIEPDMAQAIVLQNNFKNTNQAIEGYIKQYADLGEKYHIPVFIFSFGDFTDHLHFDSRVRVFRLSVYRSKMRSQDIVVPTSAEDFGRERIIFSQKRSKPIVSFCGMGGFSSLDKWAKYYIKVFLQSVLSFVDSDSRSQKIGIYWRRAMMRACSRSTSISTNFIVRHSFSGLRKTIECDPEIARKEFIDSIINADFVLTPKGDGNYSNRFVETLSFGRIPVLVDTDVVLPMEKEINYPAFVVKVPMNKVKDTPRYIRDFYDSLTEEEWQNLQQLAREMFERYLKQDSFFRRFFSKELS